MAGPKLETCKACLLRICRDKFSESDSVGVMVFDSTIMLHIPLLPFTAEHAARIEREMATVQARGGTNLWAPLHAATNLLCGPHHNGNMQWILALTDGQSGGQQDRIRALERLRQPDAGDLTVLAITVDLRLEDRQLINETCIAGRADGNAIIRADGGLAEIEAAWADAGERMTVSEKIERHGDSLTDADCHSLLREYMRLDANEWSMLQQAFWIRYLQRRCHILRSSEKFNMNERFPTFGSSTMVTHPIQTQMTDHSPPFLRHLTTHSMISQRIMLEEAHHALSEDYRHDWGKINHEQFVYWQDGEDAKWSLIATKPSEIDNARLEVLDSLELHVPSSLELRERRVLDAYLARGLGIELQDKLVQPPFEMELGTLDAIDREGFILTLDFTMKMLCMNERIVRGCPLHDAPVSSVPLCRALTVSHDGAVQECRVPCIMEGETGVSKTALTRMLFILKNQPPARNDDDHGAGLSYRQLREAINVQAANQSKTLVAYRDDSRSGPELFALQRIASSLNIAEVAAEDWNDPWRLALALCTGHDDVSTQLARQLHNAILRDVQCEPDLMVSADLWEHVQEIWPDASSQQPVYRNDDEAMARLLCTYVEACMQLRAEGTSWTFHQLNVHASLTPANIEANLTPILELGWRLQSAADLLQSSRHRTTTLCIFLDEVNTSSTMGVFKELIIDHRLNGHELPVNVVVIAACNPAREKLVHLSAVNARREELGKEWAMGHYQVHPLPLSIEQITWDYGSLTSEQEKEFIEKRLAVLHQGSDVRFPVHEQLALAALMCKSQALTRDFARQHFTISLRQAVIAAASKPLTSDELAQLDGDLIARASSVVSLRDIQRVFSLFKFFTKLLESHCAEKTFFIDEDAAESEKRRRAMLLTLGVVYYLRLSPAQRTSFENELHELPQERSVDSSLRLSNVLEDCMDKLISETQLDSDIARTTGLQENVFMVVVCCLARVPLMIVRATRLCYSLAACLSHVHVPCHPQIGPPGSSKTLAVTVVSQNAKGDQAKPQSFYRTQCRLNSFHYQCSRRSTDTEIATVFQRAIEKQDTKRGDTACFVFMDEAGLPEEQRESLKVTPANA